MRAALGVHDDVMGRAIRTHGGVWFKRVGDAVQAAFFTAPDALAAAVEAQRGLAMADWGAGEPLSVRMAVHVGEAEPLDGDYLAPCLNRLARLMSAGHGGQLLLSEAVFLLVRDAPPPGARLEPMGRHRLRDLLAPEEIYQALVDGLPDRFPPLRTLDAHPHNLPQALTPLVDRAPELAAARELLGRGDARLITLTGPGGIGKSRLALQVAADALEDFPEGAFLVALASLRDPELVLPAVASTLGVPQSGAEPLASALASRLAASRMLLVLDNVEQVLGAGPALAALLAACPGLRMLVTSRAPLRVRGEQELAVGPLPLPAEPGGDGSAEAMALAIAASPAVALFVDRAQAQAPGFRLDAGNAAAVAAICRRLDGLPLAIELAAARVRLLPPTSLLARLEGRLPQLGGGLRDLPDRQRTLAATLDWSHALLSPEQQALFRRLSVFRGGWTLELAEAVCGPGEPGPAVDAFDALAALVDMSLVQPDHGDAGPRFRMFQVVAEYAAGRLAEAGEADALGRRHGAVMAAMAAKLRTQVQGTGQGEALERLAAEHVNLGAAIEGMLARGDGQAAQAMAANLWRYWYLRGHLHEGRSLLSRAMASPGAADDPATRARAANGLGVLAWLQADFAAARAVLEEGRSLAVTSGDDSMLLRINHNLGIAAVDEGDLDTATRLARDNLALARRLDDPQGEAGVLHSLGILGAEQARVDEARGHFEAALVIQRRLGDQEGQAATLINLAALAMVAGDYPAARRLLEEGRPLAEAVEDPWVLGISHLIRGEMAIAEGRLAEARAELTAAARMRLSAGDRKGQSRVLLLAARAALAGGDALTAARVLGAAAALRVRLGAPLSPREVPAHEADVAAVRAALEVAAFDAAWRAGESLGAEDALELALGHETPG